jgi:two-component system, OmpR family, response regulator BaeR
VDPRQPLHREVEIVTGQGQAGEILIAEDETTLASVLVGYFRAAGFAASWVADGSEVVSTVRRRPPDLIILDLMLPRRDGLDICRELRTFTTLPVVMVTARVEEVDRLLGLELGADDYICKPFSPRELVARVKAILRRASRGGLTGNSLGLLIDEQKYVAVLDGQPLELTPGEFRLLSTLASAPGRVFSRGQLLDRLYPHHGVVTERVVDSHIRNLRCKLRRASPDRELIESVYGVGYKLQA